MFGSENLDLGEYSNFWAKFPKTKFALQLAINVMKHTLHKWGGNISTIHNAIEGGFQSQPYPSTQKNGKFS